MLLKAHATLTGASVIAIKQVDEGAGEAFVLTGLGITGLKAVNPCHPCAFYIID